ncbi:hypothetical protein D9619_010585 [Psilocybe cf. subviscida]|uniref:Cytochrome P450 n=1 Tax=Psilocybe cf. subviscida TaxID=2480587 RepID=A0A8H5ERT8_9AGAR|nr:hypothetical protein D9619_010585 [Psilocybe cf. subviscida]
MIHLETRQYYHAVILCLIICIYSEFRRRRRVQRAANPRGLPYPPGPRRLPIIGNVFDIARNNETEVYQRLADIYGDLVFLSAFGKNILFLNSFEMTTELFDKRSLNYSDRSTPIMCYELVGWDFSFGHMPYGSKWRSHRRVFHSEFQKSKAPKYWPIQTAQAHNLLARLLQSPLKLDLHLRHNAAAVIMMVTYGIKVSSENDPYISIAEKALEGMGQAASPGAFLVDFLPILKHIPEWVPGASFKRKAREWRTAVMEMKDLPFGTVQDQLKRNTARPSFVSNLLLQLDRNKGADSEAAIDIIRNCAGMSYAAGAESTVSVLASFILALVLHPEVQETAQEEIDRVVGSERLPEFSDRSSLPYVNAILKERIPHPSRDNRSWKHMASGLMTASKFCIDSIRPPYRRILHNPELYPEPHKFIPERFLGEGDKGDSQHLSPSDPLSVAFGYGRRFCPGRYMGEAQVWISIACLLSVFTIGHAHDESGERVAVEPRFTSKGLISHPLEFPFAIRPRNAKASNIIENLSHSADSYDMDR